MLLDSGRYSDSLGAGRSGGGIFSAVQTESDAQLASCTKRTVFFHGGKVGEADQPLLLMPGWECVGVMLPPLLVACIAIS